MGELENAEEAKATARKRFEQVRVSFPRRLSILENQLQKRLQRAKDERERLSILYKTADELFSAVLPKTPCKRGCSACCHIPVQITDEEAWYISEHTGAIATPSGPARDFLGVPCPFLKNNECSIYPHRPFACRRHVVFFPTAYWCDVSRCNTITGPQVRFSELEAAFELHLRKYRVLDIRQVFTTESTSLQPGTTGPVTNA